MLLLKIILYCIAMSVTYTLGFMMACGCIYGACLCIDKIINTIEKKEKQG